MDQNHLCYRYTTGQEVSKTGGVAVGCALAHRHSALRWEQTTRGKSPGPALVQTAIQRGSSTFPATRRASQRMPHLRGTDNRKAKRRHIKEGRLKPAPK